MLIYESNVNSFGVDLNYYHKTQLLKPIMFSDNVKPFFSKKLKKIDCNNELEGTESMKLIYEK